jgi:hypothetical protein
MNETMKSDLEIQALIDLEVERISSASPLVKVIRKTEERARNFFSRVIRIAVGLLLAALAVWLGSVAASILSTPFSELTLGNVILLLVVSVLTFIVALTAIGVSFGASESKPSVRAQAESIVRNRLESERARDLEVNELQDTSARWDMFGRSIGRKVGAIVSSKLSNQKKN